MCSYRLINRRVFKVPASGDDQVDHDPMVTCTVGTYTQHQAWMQAVALMTYQQPIRGFVECKACSGADTASCLSADVLNDVLLCMGLLYAYL